jgi:hypothetical protein
VLSTLATTTVNQLFNGLSNSLTAASSTGTDYGNKTFPGAGPEPEAYYAGGNSYTLGPTAGDVVFSIQHANQGPQTSGLAQNSSSPTATTTVPADVSTSAKGAITSADMGANGLKSQAMGETYRYDSTDRNILLRQAEQGGYNSLNVKQLELLGKTGDIKIISSPSDSLLYYTRAEWEARFQGGASGANSSRSSPLF